MIAQSVEIRMTDHGRGEVIVDGYPLRNVTSVKFEAGVDACNQLTVEVLPRAFVVCGPTRVKVLFPRGVVGWECDT